MEWAMANASTMVGAAMPVLTDHLHHRIEKDNAIGLHRKAIEQADIHNENQLEQNIELHERAIEVATEHHQREKDLSEQLHAAEMAEVNRLHVEELNKAQTLHTLEMERALELHRQSIAQQLKHHSHQINVSYEAARRENLRDVWIQKGRKADTLLITVTLLFGCLIALLCEGNPPYQDPGDAAFNISDSFIIIWSTMMGISFFSLSLCITLILAYTQRMADYNIYNPKEVYACGQTHRTFETFYDHHIKLMADYATSLFGFGSGSLLCAATMTLGARLHVQFDSEPCAWIIGGFAVVTIVANEWVRRVYGPNTRQIPAPADDEKILAWGEGIKKLSKEAHLKLETDAANEPKTEAEATQAAAELLSTPGQRITTFGLRNETHFLETETPCDHHGHGASFASVTTAAGSDSSDTEAHSVAPLRRAVSRTPSDTHSRRDLHGSRSEYLDVGHHSETASQGSTPKQTPPPRRRSFTSLFSTRIRGARSDSQKSRQYGQKAGPALNDDDFDFHQYFSDRDVDSDVLGQSMTNSVSAQSLSERGVAPSASPPPSPRSQPEKFGQHLSVAAATAKRRPSRSRLKSAAGSRRGREPTRSPLLEGMVGSPGAATPGHDLKVENRVSMVVTV